MESPIFKEHFAQNVRKKGLGAPGLARAGWFCGAGSGVAPSFYYMGCVKGLRQGILVFGGVGFPDFAALGCVKQKLTSG
jgi:hypothetical protein